MFKILFYSYFILFSCSVSYASKDLFNPDILGIKIGMQTEDALNILDKRFEKGWKYEIKPSIFMDRTGRIKGYQTSTIYISDDANEAFSIFYEPSLSKEIIGIYRLLSGKLPDNIDEQIIKKYGKPIGKRESYTTGDNIRGYTNYEWDVINKRFRSSCLGRMSRSFITLYDKDIVSGDIYKLHDKLSNKSNSIFTKSSNGYNVSAGLTQLFNKKTIESKKFTNKNKKCSSSLNYHHKTDYNKEYIELWLINKNIYSKILSRYISEFNIKKKKMDKNKVINKESIEL